jgi:hypothetical protein
MPLMTVTYQTPQQSPKWTINSKGIKTITELKVKMNQ